MIFTGQFSNLTVHVKDVEFTVMYMFILLCYSSNLQEEGFTTSVYQKLNLFPP